MSEERETRGLGHYLRWVAGNVLLRLADAAGALYFRIRNSDDEDVLTVDSQGNVSVAGDLSVAGTGPDHGGLAGLDDDDHTQYLLADGTRVLTGDWDIGDLRKLLADAVRARDAAGLALQDDGGNGIFIDDGGNIGIGTDTPDVLLHLEGPLPIIQFEDTDDGQQWRFIANLGDIYLKDQTGGTYPLWVEGGAPSYALYVDANGRVGIGTASPATDLEIENASGPVLTMDKPGTVAWRFDLSQSGPTLRIWSNAVGTPLIALDHANQWVAIGKITPQVELDVNGALQLTSPGAPDSVIIVKPTTGNARFYLRETSTHQLYIYGLDSSGAVTLQLHPEGTSFFAGGRLGIGTTSPGSELHLYSDDAQETELIIEEDGAGDSKIQWLLSATRAWLAGIDNSDGDKWKLSPHDDAFAGAVLIVDVSGNTQVEGCLSASGQQNAVIRGNNPTVNDDASANLRADGGYVYGIFVVICTSEVTVCLAGYDNTTGFYIISDPLDRFRTTDTDGYHCLLQAGANGQIKNRRGGQRTYRIHLLGVL